MIGRSKTPRTLVSGLHTIRFSLEEDRFLWCHPGHTDGSPMCGEKKDHCESMIWLDQWGGIISSTNPLTFAYCCVRCTCGYHIMAIDDIVYPYSIPYYNREEVPPELVRAAKSLAYVPKYEPRQNREYEVALQSWEKKKQNDRTINR